MADWESIRAEFEQGISQRSLALKYGISQAAISKKAARQGWVITPVIIPSQLTTSDNIDEVTDDQTTIAKAINLIARRLEEEPDNKDIKMLMDSLSQAYKIRLMLPSDQPTASGIAADLLPFLDMTELNRISELQGEIDELLQRASERKLEQEQGIKSIGKKAG